jgi:hypothetical protein
VNQDLNFLFQRSNERGRVVTYVFQSCNFVWISMEKTFFASWLCCSFPPFLIILDLVRSSLWCSIILHCGAMRQVRSHLVVSRRFPRTELYSRYLVAAVGSFCVVGFIRFSIPLFFWFGGAVGNRFAGWRVLELGPCVRPISPFVSSSEQSWRDQIVTPHVSKLHDYVNHMFKRP